MATKTETIPEEVIISDPTTVKIEAKKEGYKGPMVSVYLPKLEDEGNGVKVNQVEHVTIANEEEYHEWKVMRGVRVDVPVPVFVMLKERFPDIEI